MLTPHHPDMPTIITTSSFWDGVDFPKRPGFGFYDAELNRNGPDITSSISAFARFARRRRTDFTEVPEDTVEGLTQEVAGYGETKSLAARLFPLGTIGLRSSIQVDIANGLLPGDQGAVSNVIGPHSYYNAVHQTTSRVHEAVCWSRLGAAWLQRTSEVRRNNLKNSHNLYVGKICNQNEGVTRGIFAVLSRVWVPKEAYDEWLARLEQSEQAERS